MFCLLFFTCSFLIFLLQGTLMVLLLPPFCYCNRDFVFFSWKGPKAKATRHHTHPSASSSNHFQSQNSSENLQVERGHEKDKIYFHQTHRLNIFESERTTVFRIKSARVVYYCSFKYVFILLKFKFEWILEIVNF